MKEELEKLLALFLVDSMRDGVFTLKDAADVSQFFLDMLEKVDKLEEVTSFDNSLDDVFFDLVKEKNFSEAEQYFFDRIE